MIAIDWGSIEETFLVWRVEGTCSLEEFHAAYGIVKQMMNSKACLVDMIVDLRMAGSRTEILPKAFAYHQNNSPKNLHRIIIISQNDFWQQHFRLVENFFGMPLTNYFFTNSVDEAYLLVLPTAS